MQGSHRNTRKSTQPYWKWSPVLLMQNEKSHIPKATGREGDKPCSNSPFVWSSVSGSGSEILWQPNLNMTTYGISMKITQSPQSWSRAHCWQDYIKKQLPLEMTPSSQESKANFSMWQTLLAISVVLHYQHLPYCICYYCVFPQNCAQPQSFQAMGIFAAQVGTAQDGSSVSWRCVARWYLTELICTDI